MGLSFLFVRQIAGDDPRMVWALQLAWGLWIVSLAFLLGSHYFSARAMDRAIEQMYTGERSDGGGLDKVTGLLNLSGGIAFAVAALSAGVFLVANLGGE